MSTIQESFVQGWQSASDYQDHVPQMNGSKFNEVMDLLIERPNLNSSYLFRADILSDSCAKLQTVFEKPQSQDGRNTGVSKPIHEPLTSDERGTGGAQKASLNQWVSGSTQDGTPHDVQAPLVSGFTLTRVVVRRLIPRKPHVDRPMDQSCFIFRKPGDQDEHTTSTVVVYVPHATGEDDIPWYHPKVKSLLYQYVGREPGGFISIHFQLFPDTEEGLSNRLHRTLKSLLQTFVRLSKLDAPQARPLSSQYQLPSQRVITSAALKDTILPQHIVQDTYTRLKQTYASDLIDRWIEKTDPSKHVFEDLSIAAFLIELWNTMYEKHNFPRFVDLACGNGVLVYILLKEGFLGHGFDARRRKTWDILDIDEHLEEKLCIPEPFLRTLDSATLESVTKNVKVHNGIFAEDTFIVSNHADELTLWTPILAALSSSQGCLPFLVIPCCSHALSGVKHRYNLKDVDAGVSEAPSAEMVTEDEQLNTGDLKQLRAQKQKAASHADDASAYACLTKKTVALAEELDVFTEMTLMRIPSTRNIGVVGNRYRQSRLRALDTTLFHKMIERECHATGGLERSAQIWIERARRLIEGQGRGKVNLGGSCTSDESAILSSAMRH